MERYSHLSHAELVALAVEQARLIAEMKEHIAYQDKELARLRGGTPVADSPRTTPAFVKVNRPEREKRLRKPRPQGFARRRSAPTEDVVHSLDACPDCGRRLSEGWVHRTREVIDIPVVPVQVTRHVIMRYRCGVCRKKHTATPDLTGVVVGTGRIGVRLMSLVAYMDTVCRMPVRIIRQVLEAVYGVRLSVGEIAQLLHSVAECGRSHYDGLRQQVRASAFVHADETGAREDGINGYEWSFCTPEVRFFVRSGSRAGQVARDVLGDEFRGTLVSDFYSGYHWYSGPHQYCWVHLLRDMHELGAHYPQEHPVHRWIADVRALYDEARAFLSANPLVRRDRCRDIKNRLLAIAEPCLKSGLPQQTLAKRLVDRIAGLFTFVEEPNVPSDNNAAERAIRPYVTLRKVSGGTRSRRGSDTQAILLSLFGTWQLRGQDPLQECRAMLANTSRQNPTQNTNTDTTS